MSKKYEITDIQHPDNPRLYQIRALRDIPRFGVKAGDLGGWIESEKNLSQEGDCWIGGDARVYGNAWVDGNAQVFGDAQVFENAKVGGNARVYGNSRVWENALVWGNAWVYGDAHVGGNARVFGDARVSGNAQIGGDALVGGTIDVFSNLTANMKFETEIWRQSMTDKEIDDMSWDEIYEKINVKEWIC